MSAHTFKSFADFKRQMVAGLTFHVENHMRPEATGRREVHRVQGNGLWFVLANGNKGWCEYPKAKLARVDGSRVTFLDEAGRAKWVYSDFKRSGEVSP